MKLIKFIWQEFIYGGHLQSLGASAIIFLTSIFLKIKITWDVLIIIYLIFYLIYFYNRWKEIKIDSLTNPERSAHLKKNIHYFSFLFFIIILLLLFLIFYFVNTYSILFISVIFILGILYTSYFKEFTSKIFIFKNIYVSLIFALLPFFTMVYYFEFNFSYIFFLFSLFIFLKVLIMQIFLDIKDIESDKKLKTIPILLGKEKTLKLLQILTILISIFIPIVFSLLIPVLPKIFLVFILTAFLNFYCFELVKKNNHYGYILASGEIFLWSIFFFFAILI